MWLSTISEFVQIVATWVITRHREPFQILTYHKEACFIFPTINVTHKSYKSVLIWFFDGLKLFLIQTLSGRLLKACLHSVLDIESKHFIPSSAHSKCFKKDFSKRLPIKNFHRDFSGFVKNRFPKNQPKQSSHI